jgi:hypothetical protein
VLLDLLLRNRQMQQGPQAGTRAMLTRSLRCLVRRVTVCDAEQNPGTQQVKGKEGARAAVLLWCWRCAER